MPATPDLIHKVLVNKYGTKVSTDLEQKMSQHQIEDFLCSLDPIFFMRHYVKIRSQPDADEEDEEDELDNHQLTSPKYAPPSTIEYLDPWAKQIELIDGLQEYHWVIAPKSRKIGFTTIGIGFGCWCQKYIPSCRVHYISRRDDAATNMLRRHQFSMRSLPDYMKMKESQHSGHVYGTYGATGDERIVQAYPATEDTAIEETADFTLLDEFASIREPLASKLWSGLEPTIAPNGYLLIISRGKGPQGTFAGLVRQAQLIQREEEVGI